MSATRITLPTDSRWITESPQSGSSIDRDSSEVHRTEFSSDLHRPEQRFWSPQFPEQALERALDTPRSPIVWGCSGVDDQHHPSEPGRRVHPPGVPQVGGERSLHPPVLALPGPAVGGPSRPTSAVNDRPSLDDEHCISASSRHRSVPAGLIATVASSEVGEYDHGHPGPKVESSTYRCDRRFPWESGKPGRLGRCDGRNRSLMSGGNGLKMDVGEESSQPQAQEVGRSARRNFLRGNTPSRSRTCNLRFRRRPVGETTSSPKSFYG